jgi:hypothetical protein
MKLLFLFSFLLIFSLSSCRYFNGEEVRGDGNVISQQRNVSNFNAIDAGGAVEVHLVQGPAGVKVTADGNLQEYVEVFTEGDVLVIQYKQNTSLEPSADIKIFVSVPSLNSIEVSGASKLIADGPYTGTTALQIKASGASNVTMNISVPKLDVDISGASHANLQGKATDIIASASGASEIRAMELVSETADIDVSGASDTEITANSKINIEASGASSVSYKGNAAVSQNVSGAGSVKKVQ